MWTTSASRCGRRRGPGGEYRNPARERPERPEPERRLERALGLAAERDHQVGDEPAVRVEVGAEVVAGADDEHAPVGRHGRDRGAAAVEHDHVRPALGREPGAVAHVRDERAAGEPTAGAAAADRDDTADSGDLEMVGGRMPARAGQRDELLYAGRPLDDLRPGGPPRPIVTTTTSRSRARSRARCADTAVLPTRFPVPITAIDGTSTSS